MRARLRRIPVPLLVLLAIAALEALGWAVATAPLDGPDEVPGRRVADDEHTRDRHGGQRCDLAPEQPRRRGDGEEEREDADRPVWGVGRHGQRPTG